MGTDVILQFAMLIFSLAIFFLLPNLSKQALTKLRSKTRSKALAHRHFVQGAHFLSKARSTHNQTTSSNFAKSAVSEADKALSIDPKDASAHILKALAHDLLGHKTSALKSLDAALSPPAVKTLSERERGDALFKRAEVHMKVNRRRRVDSAVLDLVESVRLSGGETDEKVFCLLGECYEMKGMKEDAQKAFEEALKVDPGSVLARDWLIRLRS